MGSPLAISDMAAEIIKAREAEEEMFGTPVVTDTGVDPQFVKSCLYNYERGDGFLYSALNGGKFIQVRSWGKDGQWLEWGGHHWIEDKLDHARNAVDGVAKRYLAEATRLQDVLIDERDKEKIKAIEQERKLYYDRAKKLRNKSGADNCLDWSLKIGNQSLAIVGDDIDTHPMLLACKNGVLNLRTGILSPGQPKDYLLRAVPIEWKGLDEPCPTWDAFFDEIHQSDTEIIAFLDRLFGYSLTGLTTEHFIALFLGEGRNGKGTMFETLREILGDLAWNVSPELLIEQKNARSSAGPSPDLISLKGRRMVIASESDENRRISGQQVKRLTGADTITARAPHDRDETNIKPTWKLFFYTNHIPKGMAADFALAQRLIYLQYPLKFVDNPNPGDPLQRKKDGKLPAKLLQEAPGILARLVRGCMDWQNRGGLFPPDKIRNAVDALQRSEDTFRQFWDDGHESGSIVADPAARAKFSDLYTSFATWYAETISDSDRFRPSKKAVATWLEKAAIAKEKTGGTVYLHGLRLLLGDLP